jgi:hypothetical protein
VTWRVYGCVWVLTWQVPCFTGLPAPLCNLLAHLESLTSRLNGDEGVSAAWVAVVRLASASVVTSSLKPK